MCQKEGEILWFIEGMFGKGFLDERGVSSYNIFIEEEDDVTLPLLNFRH